MQAQAMPPADVRRARGGRGSGRTTRIAGRVVTIVVVAIVGTVLQGHFGTKASSLNTRCVTLSGVGADGTISEIRCGWKHDGKVIAVVDSATGVCPAGTDTTFTPNKEKAKTLCIDLEQ